MNSQPDTADIHAQTTITSVPIICAYVDDYEEAFEFYNTVLGLEKQSDMGENACFFKLGTEGGLYLEGGNTPAELTAQSVRSSFTLGVGSATAMYEKLKAAGTPMIHPAPVSMGQGYHWFQFCDPAGNILEVLAGE